MIQYSMACADCIGQNGGGRGYILSMRVRRKFLWPGLLAWTVAALLLRADPGDVDNSHDYPGFPRLPNYLITDYDEDNPADFDFPVSRPLPIDADHLETVSVKGHRYVIRYELSSGKAAPSLLQTQQYYEKLAAAADFTVEKTGAVGDVTETFHQAKGGHDIWVYLEPSIRVNVLTVVESKDKAPAPPRPTPAPPALASSPSATPPPAVKTQVIVGEDPFYTALMQKGHVVLPLTFLPGKPDLDADSQPVIDRVIAMLKLHPDLVLEIDGHTDNTGDAAENLNLSEQRARTVRSMILSGHIEKKRLTAVGIGGARPLGDNETAAGREKNRRIELVLPKNIPANISPQNDSAADSFEKGSSEFHAPAPDGTNYYPSNSTPNKGH